MVRMYATLALGLGLTCVTGCAHDRARERTSISAVTNREATGDRAEPGKTRMHYTKVTEPHTLRHDKQADEQRMAQTPACERVVYFDTGSATLDKRDQDQLASVAHCITRKHIDHAFIEGQTDPNGPAAYNRELGMERARAVAAYLHELGVPSAELRLRSRGETAAADNARQFSDERSATVTVTAH
jgi:outer membrane protein OmpA-like peptidoglycan-associated protein